MWSLGWLALGLALLLVAAEWLVEGASHLADRAGVPPLMVGLTVVAFGTSAPELVVNLVAASRGQGDLVLANVIGSDIANTCLVLGVGALLCPLAVARETLQVELPAGLLAMATVAVMANDAWFGAEVSTLSRGDGVLLLLGFAVFLGRVLSTPTGEAVEVEGSARWALAGVVGGLVGLPVGADLVASSAAELALSVGISEAAVGLSIVSIGTSLPELVTTAAAAWRGKPGLAVGNVVGSNLFNLLLVLGASAVVGPIAEPAAFGPDAVFFGLATVGVAVVAGRSGRVGRSAGIVLVVAFVVYLLSLGFRSFG